MEKVRIDKWLWAARFFKTRNLAKQAIEGGKVQCDGQRIKASKEITTQMQLSIRQGWDIKIIDVKAALLYQETDESIEKRAAEAEQRKQLKGLDRILPEGRPNKKQRRQIHRFRDLLDESLSAAGGIK